MAEHRTAGHRTAVRFPPTVWRGLKLLALDYDTSAVALVRQALTDALEGDTATLAASSHQYRDTPGQLVTLDLPIVLHRRLRLAVIAHGSTAMAVVLAAIYASWPELVPTSGPGTGRSQRQPTTDTRRLSMATDTDAYAKAIAAAQAASAAVASASAASALAKAASAADRASRQASASAAEA